MPRNKNIFTLVLMTSSIVLLVLLQVFWLRNSYEKAFHDLRRESSSLFRTTVFSLRDSLFLTHVEQVPTDSGETIAFRTRVGGTEQKVQAHVTDTAVKFIGIHEETSKIQILVSDSTDILQEDFVGPLSMKIRRSQFEGKPGVRKSFIIKMGPDTLNVDTIAMHYTRALNAAGINVPFQVIHKIMPPRFRDNLPGLPHPELEEDPGNEVNVLSDTLRSGPVPISPYPAHQYEASLTGIRGLILREISPQILFALFLTLVTTASFVFMYRNIRAQQRLMDSKNEFISNVTHELKTPVATVSVALEALKNFNAMQNPKLTEEYLDIALRELNRLAVMTDKVLNTSIYESRGVEFTPEEVDLDQAILQMLTSMKVVFDKRGAMVDYKTEGSDFKLAGSTLHLTNVLYNLVDNALKYSGETPHINISLTNDGHKIVLTVEDNGMGIPPAYQRKIFEKFFRVPSGDIHNIKGYGLGLSYVASVVKSHNGVIDVKSEPGKGSTFIITLPRIPGKAFRAAIGVPAFKPTTE